MTLPSLMLLLLVAGGCGAIGQAIAGNSRGGFLVAIALGFIGALIGAWFAFYFALPEIYVMHIGTTSFPIVWSMLGATLFVALISLMTPQRRRV